MVTPTNVFLIHKWSLKGKVLIPRANIKGVAFAWVAVITLLALIVSIAKKDTFVPWTLVR